MAAQVLPQLPRIGMQVLKAYPALKALRKVVKNTKKNGKKKATRQQAQSEPVHQGIRCDHTGMNPIIGARYMKQMENDTFDLCQAAYDALPEEEKSGFVCVKSPEDVAAVAAAKAAYEAAKAAEAEEAARI